MSSSSAARRKHSPLFGGASFAPVAGLTGLPLIQSLSTLTSNLISKHSSHPTPLHRAETRSLLRKLNILLLIFESLTGYSLPSSSSSSSSSSTTTLCFSELYTLLHRAGDLLDCCSRSGRLWLLLRGRHLSAHFHSLALDLSLILDVLPISTLNLPCDIHEHAELLRRQCRHSTPQFSHHDNLLQRQILSFLDILANGQVPSSIELYRAFVDQLGVCDAAACRAEIEFLEELIYSSDKVDADDLVVLGGLAALARYCSFLLFGFQELDTTKKTTEILARRLADRVPDATKAITAREHRMLAKTGKENRASIAEACAIPLLCCEAGECFKAGVGLGERMRSSGTCGGVPEGWR